MIRSANMVSSADSLIAEHLGNDEVVPQRRMGITQLDSKRGDPRTNKRDKRFKWKALHTVRKREALAWVII